MSQPPPYAEKHPQGAPPAGQPGYPPAGQPGYPPAGQPGYPPAGQPGYPPAGQPGYPPAGQPGYPPAGQPGYPPAGQPMYQPQPGAYPPPQQGSTVVLMQPNVPVITTFGAVPVRTRCSTCNADIVTSVSYEPGTYTWLMCVLLCIFVGFFGLIPFCCDECKDTVHHCPSCQAVVGQHRRM